MVGEQPKPASAPGSHQRFFLTNLMIGGPTPNRLTTCQGTKPMSPQAAGTVTSTVKPSSDPVPPICAKSR
jgi:hypothetical protein